MSLHLNNYPRCHSALRSSSSAPRWIPERKKETKNVPQSVNVTDWKFNLFQATKKKKKKKKKKISPKNKKKKNESNIFKKKKKKKKKKKRQVFQSSRRYK